jgi:hypothetical protein
MGDFVRCRTLKRRSPHLRVLRSRNFLFTCDTFFPCSFPAFETVYEYFVDPKRHGWAPWEEKLSSNFRPSPELPFFKIVVPTVDTRRTEYVLRALVLANRHALVVGNVGVGKTLIVQGVLANLPEGRAAMTINFSAQTSSNSLQVGGRISLGGTV